MVTEAMVSSRQLGTWMLWRVSLQWLWRALDKHYRYIIRTSFC
jgi:hypothetical protein